MRQLTIVMAYYDNPGMLARQFETMASYDPFIKTDLEFILTDDGSPKVNALEVWQAFLATRPVGLNFPFQLFRVEEDVRWNQDMCRNVGAHHATKPWLLLTDIDHLIPNDTLRAILHYEHLSERAAYKFSRVNDQTLEPYKVHPNTWLMTKVKYEEADGYDERFAGWYGTDGDFRDRVHARCEFVKQLPHPIIRVGREHIADASCPREFGRKSSVDAKKIADIKRERNKQKGWRTLRLSRPYLKQV